MRPRTVAAALAAGAAVLGAVTLAPGTARAETTYDASAVAYGARVTYTSGNTPLGVVPEASGPAAEARLSSLPRSSALAAFPYPGDGLVGLPGLISAVVPGSPPLPQYPFYAHAELGDDPNSVSAPGIELAARSSDRVADARAESLSASTGYVSTAHIEHTDDGTVAALAEARQSALDLAGLVTLDGIHSVAKVAADADGKLTRSSALEIDALRVPGVHFTPPSQTPNAGPGGAVVGPSFALRNGQFYFEPPAGNGVEIPIATKDFFAALAAAGVTGSYQAATDTATGVLAPVLSLTATLPAPPPNPAGFAGSSAVRLDIGQANALIDARLISGLPAAPPTAAAPASPVAGTGLPAALPAAPVVAPAAAPLPGGVPTVALISQSPAREFTPLASTLALHRSGARGAYLALIGACLIGVVTVRIVVARGVRP
ncbi:MAG TPA: choice-of-anchor P family protein [Sporichthyaceae bacterium]|jgi:hypothetical protein